MTLRKKADELGGLIKTFIGLRLITQAVSIASGFLFFYYTMRGFISGFTGSDIVAAMLGILILIAIEFSVQYTVTKGIKFAYLKNGRLATGLGLLAAMFFSISFYISTQGIYLAFTDTTDKVVNVDEGYADEKAMIIAEYDQRIQEMKQDLEKIKAPSWNKGNLTTPQQEQMAKTRAEINSLYDEKAAALSRLKADHEAELASVEGSAEKQASDYYLYVCIILMMELLTNGLITHWYYEIKREEDPGLAIEDEYSTLLEQQQNNIRATFFNDSVDCQREIVAQLQNIRSQRTAYTPTLRDYQIAASASPHIVGSRPEIGRPSTTLCSADGEAPTADTDSGNNDESLVRPSTTTAPTDDPVSAADRSKKHPVVRGFSQNSSEYGDFCEDGKFYKIQRLECPPLNPEYEAAARKWEQNQATLTPSDPEVNGYATDNTDNTDTTDSTPPRLSVGAENTDITHIPTFDKNGKPIADGYCHCCGKSLAGMRADAKWCSPVCRAKGNGFKSVKPAYLKN